MDSLHQELTEKIIGTFYDVYNELGYGFMEKVYQNSLHLELMNRGFAVEGQKRISVYFKGTEVGEYFADLVVNDTIILELKAAEAIVEEHESQLLNYLRGSNKEIGLILNFGKRPQIKRKIYQKARRG